MPYFLLARAKYVIVFMLLTVGVNAVALAQSLTVKGRVTNEKSEPLPNMSVVIKGTTTGAATDANGEFLIKVPNNHSVLVLSSIGFETQEITVGNQTNLNIVMKAGEAAQLNAVIVVGYGTQRKATVTGAVAQVKGAELEKSPVPNLSNSLSGRLPGISTVQGSGEPGYDGSTIRIRGTNTFGNTSALIVVDGVPDVAGGLERINPADIERMSVLKDASAAIYGSRAANGVILVTTKHGRTGKPQFSYTL